MKCFRKQICYTHPAVCLPPHTFSIQKDLIDASSAVVVDLPETFSGFHARHPGIRKLLFLTFFYIPTENGEFLPPWTFSSRAYAYVFV